MKLIVKGDDLGWTDGVNAGIEKAARDGILTATGAMPNMAAAERGIKLLQKYPHVSIGQHTNVIIGKPVSDPAKIPHMVDQDGNFLSSRYYRAKQKEHPELDVIPYYDECYTEIAAQVDRFTEYAGQKPAYLEGHAIPSKVCEQALADYAATHDIIYLGVSLNVTEHGVYHANLGQYAYDIFTSDDPYAQFHADVESFFLNDERHILDHEIALVLFHPGFVDADLMRMSTYHGVRIRDCEALCSPHVKQWIKENRVELINYYDLKRLGVI